jgi:hypothetical protein
MPRSWTWRRRSMPGVIDRRLLEEGCLSWTASIRHLELGPAEKIIWRVYSTKYLPFFFTKTNEHGILLLCHMVTLSFVVKIASGPPYEQQTWWKVSDIPWLMKWATSNQCLGVYLHMWHSSSTCYQEVLWNSSVSSLAMSSCGYAAKLGLTLNLPRWLKNCSYLRVIWISDQQV